MQVLLENGYVSSYAFDGNIIGGIEVPDPPDIEHFEAHFQSYLVRDGTLELDNRNVGNDCHSQAVVLRLYL